MKLFRFYSFLFLTAVCASASEPAVNISGTVTDGSHPVEKAIVSLVNNAKFSDTTDSKGAFTLSNVTAVYNKTDLSPEINSMVRIHGSKLLFTIPGKTAIGETMIHNASGVCVLRYTPEKNESGSMIVDLPALSTGLYIVTFSANRSSIIQKLVVTTNKMYLCGNRTSPGLSTDIHQLTSTLAAVDQLKITKVGFVTKQVDLSSYKSENLSIVFEPESIATATSLYKRYKNFFPIGAAVDGNSYTDNHATIWKKHFNSMVCENEMKWTALEPSSNSFQFTQANAMVNAARSNGMLVRGHVLCWFDQTPDWVFQNASKEVLLGRLRNHISKVMTEFKGRVYAWDVVNEAVVGLNSNNEDVGEDIGSLARWGYRNSKWYQIAGEDHIFEAFKAARAADPNAKLFYNDFWNYLDGKREFILTFVKKLKEQNLIDGVGLQCHLNISPALEKKNNQSVHQTVSNLEKEIQAYAALGLDVHITELDISIYTRDYTSDDESKWFTDPTLNDEYQNKLAARYKEFFDMFRRNADKIKNVTFWGFSDDNTWLSEFPSGRPDFPLLFDKDLKPKKAFDAIMNF
jgi:endo-1,4-beta-xylanase